MTLRVDIDERDIARLLRDIDGRFSRQARRAFVAYAACGAVFVAASVAAIGAGLSVMAAQGDVGAVDWRDLALLGASLVVGVLACVGAGLTFGANKTLAAARLKDLSKTGLATGRFEFNFTKQALIARHGALLRKFSWFGLDRIEETKANIIFWRRGAVAAFIPRNGVRDEALFEKLSRIHGPAIGNKLSVKKGEGVNPHKVVFEARADDLRDYARLRLRQRDKRIARMSAFLAWPAWPAVLLVLSLQGAGLCAYYLVSGLSLEAGLGLAASLAVLGLVWRRAAAHPVASPAASPRGGKAGASPFRQSEMVSVVLANDGVMVRREDGEAVYPWDAFDGVAHTPFAFCLVLSPEDVIAAPKRAFIDKHHFKAFTTFAKTRLDASRQHRARRLDDRIARSANPSRRPASPAPAGPAPASPKPVSFGKAAARAAQ